MSTLNVEQFNTSLSDFVLRVNELSPEKWTLHKRDRGLFAKQSVMVCCGEEMVNRQMHITHHPSYNVPVLWFNFYRRDGSPLSFDEIVRMGEGHPNGELVSSMTVNEHPYLDVLFYHIHPCNTAKIMSELPHSTNYIASWLSVYGAPLGLVLPSSFFSPPQPLDHSEGKIDEGNTDPQLAASTILMQNASVNESDLSLDEDVSDSVVGEHSEHDDS